MQILKLQFHTSSNLLARFPALQTRISRSAHEKNLKRIQRLKKKLGDDYRLIGRDKRQSPLTQVRSPSKPSQPPKPIPTKLIIEPLLLKPNYEPLPIIPSNWKDSIKNQLKAQETENLKVGKGLRELVPQQVQKQVELTKLELSPKVVPELLMNGDRPGQTLSGPYYNYGILPNECEKIFQSSSTDLFKQEYSQEQLELARRILSTNNSNAQQIRKFNTKRMVELFQRYPGDCGSSEVQAAVMMVKIKAIKEHLQRNPKDKSTKRRLQAWESKQQKALKYLKRQDVQKFVETCEALGLDAKTI